MGGHLGVSKGLRRSGRLPILGQLTPFIASPAITLLQALEKTSIVLLLKLYTKLLTSLCADMKLFSQIQKGALIKGLVATFIVSPWFVFGLFLALNSRNRIDNVALSFGFPYLAPGSLQGARGPALTPSGPVTLAV